MQYLNIMLGKGLGGLEQVAIDYQTALSAEDVKITTLLRKGAQITPPSGQEQAYHHLALSPLPWISRKRFHRFFERQKPTALLLHGNKPLKLLGGAQSSPIKRIFIAHNYRTKAGIHNMDGVIAVSSPVRDHIIKEGVPAEKVHVVNNMTKIQKVPRPPFQETAPIIGMLTRLHPVKGVDILIDALYKLHQEGQNFTAKIAGEGPERANLEALVKSYGIEDKVTFIGWINDKETFLSSIDILAAPSRSEAFPVTIVESISAGVPLVLSDLKGPCSVLTPGQEALITPVDDSNALKEALKRLITNPDLRRTMLNAQAKLALNFTEKNIAGKLKKALTAICQS